MAIQIMQKRAKLTNFYSKKEDFTQNITIYIQSWATDVYLNIQSEYLKPTWPENLTTLRININWQVSVSWKRVQQTKFYNLANAMLGGRRPSISTTKTQRGAGFSKKIEFINLFHSTSPHLLHPPGLHFHHQDVHLLSSPGPGPGPGLGLGPAHR